MKILSYYLRHQPPCPIDNYGWCLINDLLPYLKINKEQLEQVVLLDDKMRFVINDDKIRACQGHTIKLETPILNELLLESNIKNAYHATTIEGWKKIQEDGYLSPMKRTHIHFATNIKNIRNIKKQSIVLSLNIREVILDNIKLYLSTNNVLLCPTNIPIKYVKIIL